MLARPSARPANMAEEFDEVRFRRQVAADARRVGDGGIALVAAERLRLLRRLERDAELASLQARLASETQRADEERDLRRRIAESEEALRQRLADALEENRRLVDQHDDEIGRVAQAHEDLSEEGRKRRRRQE